MITREEIEQLDALIAKITAEPTTLEHQAIIERHLPELMVAARAKHGDIIPCSGYTDWFKCVVVYEEFDKVMINYNDKVGNTYAVELPIKPVA